MNKSFSLFRNLVNFKNPLKIVLNNSLQTRHIFFTQLKLIANKMDNTNEVLKNNKSCIVWVDLEMTGLDVENDKIIEMACLITDKDLNVIAEGPDLVIKQSDEILDQMDDWCKRTHGESGLTQAVRDSKIDIQEAERQMLEFLCKHVPKGSCPLAGNSIHVDRMFLNKQMSNFLNYLHYRIVDVSTLKELVRRWYPQEKYFSKSNAHRALDDIKESIQELKHYREKLFKSNKQNDN